MKQRFRNVLVIIGSLTIFWFISCMSPYDYESTETTGTTTEPESPLTQAPSQAPKDSNGPPPLVVDMSEPLLLDEPATDTGEQVQTKNQTCLVCHGNYASEELATIHARAQVMCSGCHGESIEHKNDENNTTPPEKMFPNDKIRAFCAGCHDPHEIKAEMIRERLGKRPGQVNVIELVCTDCHGKHRMDVRTVIWDKRTGKLLRTNRGQ